jgi:hypothetical protein
VLYATERQVVWPFATDARELEQALALQAL